MSCDVGCRRDSDVVLLWLQCRPEATVPIQPLAWAPPYAVGVALKRLKKKKKSHKSLPSFRYKPVLWTWDLGTEEEWSPEEDPETSWQACLVRTPLVLPQREVQCHTYAEEGGLVNKI